MLILDDADSHARLPRWGSPEEGIQIVISFLGVDMKPFLRQRGLDFALASRAARPDSG